jgi:hypothetical protein
MTFKHTNRRDSNEKDILALWRRMGAKWIPMGPGIGFDGLLIFGADKHVVEIKRPECRGRLTEAELECKEAIEAMGGSYEIITDLEEAAKLLGKDIFNE